MTPSIINHYYLTTTGSPHYLYTHHTHHYPGATDDQLYVIPHHAPSTLSWTTTRDNRMFTIFTNG